MARENHQRSDVNRHQEPPMRVGPGTLIGPSNRMFVRAPSLSEVLLTAWMALMLSSILLRAATATAKFERETVAAGESVKLSIVVEGGTPEYAPQPPQIQNLTAQYVGSSQQYTIVNGRASQSVTLDYSITPRQPGSYTIPALSVGVDGKTVKTQPIGLNVLKADANPNDPNGLSRLAFIRLIVPKKEAYVNEVIPIEMQLFVQSAEDLQLPQIAGEGFTYTKPMEAGRSRGQANGQTYNVLVFKLTATAVKTGDLNLGPVNCELTLLLQPQRRRRDPGDPFGDISEFFGGRVERKRIKLSSTVEKMNILPLPSEGRPEDFSGAVGKFTFEATVAPTSLSVGDPITITTRISGRGNLDGIQFRIPGSWNNFRTYPPISKTEADPLGVEGTKTFENVVAPEISDIKEVPALQFSYFDPDEKAYRTLRRPPVPLTLRAVAAAQAQPTILAPSASLSVPAARKDIVHIKSRMGALATMAPPLLNRPWFLWLQAFPFFLLLSVIAWQRRNELLAKNPHERRRRQTNRVVTIGLAQLEKAAGARDTELFFQTLFRMLQEQLGERLDVPASSITESVIDENLKPGGAHDEMVDALHDLFQACNQARYARERTSGELQSVLAKARTVIASMKTLTLGSAK